MSPIINTNNHHFLVKRQLLKANIGGQEQNPKIHGNNNKVMFGSAADAEAQLTLLRKAGQQVGKILEGGTDVVLAPAKWLAHMQDSWYAYSVQKYTDPLWKMRPFGLFLLQQI